jgi:hypothetical protein
MKLPSLNKFLLVFTLFAFCSLFFAPVQAASKWATSIGEMQSIRDESNGFSLEKFTSINYLYFLYLFNESVSGKSVEKDRSTKKPISEGSGAIHIVGNYIAQMIAQPPTSSVDYIADLGHQINPIKPVFAQGTGYQGLSDVLEAWKGFRNVSYGLFVIIFVIVGFMIMFRAKLNPQTVVNLQMALPKLIITLLLITFSYAIAGFIIDLIYFVIYLAVSIFKTIPGMNLYDSGTEFLKQPLADLIRAFQPDSIASNFATSLGNLFPEGSVAELLTGSFLGVQLVQAVTGGVILFSVLKLLVQLVLAYVNIILQVIFAPIILLFNALPQSNTFSSWIKNLLANAAAFPATAIMILVGSSLTSGPDSTASFTPPFLGTLEGLNNFSQDVIGLGTIILLPKVVTTIQEVLKAKSPLPIGPAIAEGVTGAAALPTSFFRSRREAQIKRQESQFQAQRIGEEVRKKNVG